VSVRGYYSTVRGQGKVSENPAYDSRFVPNASVGIGDVLLCLHIEDDSSTRRFFILYVQRNHPGILKACPERDVAICVPQTVTIWFCD
jgi:hypothetical protein